MTRRSKRLVERIFNPREGWPFSKKDIPIQKVRAEDGNPNFIVTVGGLALSVFEMDKWAGDETSNVAPGRIVVRLSFPGVEVTDPRPFLLSNYGTGALPSLGIDQNGAPALAAAFPIFEQFPLEVARNQTMVCMGLVAEQGAELLRAWHENSANTSYKFPISWSTVENLMSAANLLLDFV